MTDDLFSFFNVPQTSIPARTSYDFETTLIKSIPYVHTSRGFPIYEHQFFSSNIIVDEIVYFAKAIDSPDEFLISFSEEKLDLSIRNKFDIDGLSLSKHTTDTLKILESIGLENNKDYKIVKYDCGKDDDTEELVFTFNGLVKYCNTVSIHIETIEPLLRERNADIIEYAHNQLKHVKILQKKHAKAVIAEANFNKARNPTKRWLF